MKTDLQILKESILSEIEMREKLESKYVEEHKADGNLVSYHMAERHHEAIFALKCVLASIDGIEHAGEK